MRKTISRAIPSAQEQNVENERSRLAVRAGISLMNV
jgi:hypothetical protein